MQTQLHHQVVIVGGGAAGISVAARVSRAFKSADIAVIEPSRKHYYQPLWTLVGGGVVRKEVTERDEASLIPAGVKWLHDAVTEFCPQDNCVLTQDGKRVSYDFLVVAPGIQIDWDKIPGLRDNLGRDGVCSNYAYQYVDKTWEALRTFKGGTAIFTQPSTPIKCGGAPQKIAYLADDYFRQSGVRDRTTMMFITGTATIFTSPYYASALTKVAERKGIQTRFKHDLVEIVPATKEAVFKNLDTGELVILTYDMIHVTPPMSAPDFVKQSPLADAAGWVDVDKWTLQHKRYPNIFGLGDASNLPTSKTGAAVRKQAVTVAQNLVAALKGNPLNARYNGYTSCPLVTGYKSLIMAEFDYDLKPKETFPFDQSKERYSMYLLKRYGLPRLYWHGMLKGLV
jgi:sulfide:quinone oxidoreductase